MLSPRGCVSPYLGRGPVRDMSLPNEWGQAPFVPQGHCFEGGSGPPGQGCPSSDGRQGGHRLRTLPLLKVGGGGGQPAWPCHCWSERERAARDRELSQSSNGRQEGQRQDGEGAGSLLGGRAAVSQTGLGQDHKGCPRASQQGSVAPGTSVPPAPLRLVPEALWGVEALPCHRSGHTVEEEGTGEEHGVITFQRNEVRAPLFPI